jgi:hypothetical protein
LLQPESEGYLAIVRPKFGEGEDILQTLTTKEQYKELRKKK